MKTWIGGAAAAGIGVAGTAALVVSSLAGPSAQAAVAVVLAAAAGIGWPYFLGIPAKKTNGTILALAGAAAGISAAAVAGPEYLFWTPAAIAFGLMAVTVVQLIRGTGQSHRLESALGASTGVLLCCLGAGWIATARLTGTGSMLIVAGISTAVALLVGAINWPDTIIAPLAVVFAGLAAPLAALVMTDISVIPATVAGALIGAVLAAVRRLNRTRSRPMPPAGLMALALAPVLAVGSLAYFIDKLLLY
ncbi:permease [Sinomonas sp. JGH33]|uniref:Permease n=1 Tax=Sinomonas terricola TaxID=3110330 RepID=A0ABU5T1J2_9MICC|nr:permease [Sinomonas sp. JGH33]MEA5453528.1 permease [Sinomonas sp. JGH33]